MRSDHPDYSGTHPQIAGLVDLGCSRLYIDCVGIGNPLVVMDGEQEELPPVNLSLWSVLTHFTGRVRRQFQVGGWLGREAGKAAISELPRHF
jgi:hypothetical protein